jgi:hypothetical protein
MSSSHANARPVTSFLSIHSGPARQRPLLSAVLTRCYSLFFRAPRLWNSRIPAANTMSLTDNFLQKQQKQRERQPAKGGCGNPAGRPRASRNRSAHPIGLVGTSTDRRGFAADSLQIPIWSDRRFNS